MPKYIAYAIVKKYHSFQFEADNDDLAWDHIEQLAFDRGPSYIVNEWEESGPEEIEIESVDWLED